MTWANVYRGTDPSPNHIGGTAMQENVDLANACMTIDAAVGAFRNFITLFEFDAIDRKLVGELEKYMTKWVTDHEVFVKGLLPASRMEFFGAPQGLQVTGMFSQGSFKNKYWILYSLERGTVISNIFE